MFKNSPLPADDLEQHSNLLISVNSASNLALFSPALIEAQPRDLGPSNSDTSQAVPLNDKHRAQPWRQTDIIPISSQRSEAEIRGVMRKKSSFLLLREVVYTIGGVVDDV